MFITFKQVASLKDSREATLLMTVFPKSDWEMPLDTAISRLQKLLADLKESAKTAHITQLRSLYELGQIIKTQIDVCTTQLDSNNEYRRKLLEKIEAL